MSEPRFESTDRGPTVFRDGRYLYSKRDPSRLPDRIAGSVPCEERCLYLVPSPLLGYGLRILADRIPENSHVLAFESSPELFTLCVPAVPADLLNRPDITWARSSDTPSIAALLDRMGPWRFRRVRRVDLNGGTSADPDLYERLCVFAEERLANYWRNRHALGRMGRSWIRHLYSNLIAASKGSFATSGAPVFDRHQLTVVVGAGPSLEDGLAYLREQRDKIRILCTDTALSALLSEGIRPDAVSVLETQAWNLLDFHGARGSGIPVLADMTSYPPTFEATGGPVIPFSTAFAELELLERLGKAGLRPLPLPPLGSVGLSTVELALRLGDGPVLLVGLDFCYRPGKSHARGTSVHAWQLAVRDRLNPYPGYAAAMHRPKETGNDAHGGSVRTDSVLKGYADLLTDRYSGEKRLFVLAPGGLDLSLPVLSPSDAAVLASPGTGLPGGFGTSPAAGQSGGARGRSVLEGAAAAAFIESERTLLEAVVASWNRYASGEGTASEVAGNLVRVDHVYCDFPDEPPLPKEDNAFLVRAVNRVRTLMSLLERCSEASSGIRT